MCCFSSRMERVSGTRIFVRAEGERQLVVYEMSLLAQGELAMVLPIPAPGHRPYVRGVRPNRDTWIAA